jgi:two-component system chemotaxis response regulator CheB
VIICSTLVSIGSSSAIDALRLGAVEIIKKPQVGIREFFLEQKEEFIRAIKIASKANINYKPKLLEMRRNIEQNQITNKLSEKFIAIGSSTGGVQVIEDIVTAIKVDHPCIVITQHMPEGFTASFATRLNSLARSKIVEATNGEVLTNNKIIIAKGGIHMEIIKNGEEFSIKLKDFPKVNSHKPSVNVLFNSIAKISTQNVLAFILTGMGDDGAIGLKKLKDKGNQTYGQDEKSSAIYGMPQVAYQIGAIIKQLSIKQIIEKINNFKG